MASHYSIRKTVKSPEPGVAPEIPDKLYFRIGDVAKLCGVAAYVLRFWETEFPQLKPNKGGTGQRLYRRKDVDTALRIKSLLYDQGYTIPGARQVLRTETRPAGPAPQAVEPTPQQKRGPGLQKDSPLHALRDELRSLSEQLNLPVAETTDAIVRPGRSRSACKSAAAGADGAGPTLEQRDLFASE